MANKRSCPLLAMLLIIPNYARHNFSGEKVEPEADAENKAFSAASNGTASYVVDSRTKLLICQSFHCFLLSSFVCLVFLRLVC